MIDAKILGFIVKLGSNYGHVPEILALSSIALGGRWKGLIYMAYKKCSVSVNSYLQ